MKKTLFILMLSFFALSGLQAQKLSIGVKGGLNMTSISTEESIADNAAKAGMHIGAFVELKLLKVIALQPELLFSMQGTASEIDGIGDVKINTNYVNMPIMLKFYLIPGLINIELGPQFGFLLSANYSDDVNDILGDPKTAFKNADLSGCFGLGVDISKLQLSARYNLGLSDINDISGVSGVQSFVQRNQVFQFSLGYKF